MTDPAPPLALVTGAAKGIGAATARSFLAAGWQVVAVDIAPVDCPGADVGLMDVRDTDAVQAVVGAAEARYGRAFDAVVNNAGFATLGPIDSLTDEAWSEVINLNLSSMMRVSRAALPAMRRARRGSVICLSSIAGHIRGWPGRIAYSSAKAGVAGFVRTLAMEVAADGVTVNGVAPSGMAPHAKAEQVPLGRAGEPEEVAEVILFLAGPQARFVTGQTLAVDGGLSVSL